MVTFIFYEGIITPPSEIGAIRDLMLYGQIFCNKEYEYLLEAEPCNKDIYYRWLKTTHLYDYITDIVTPEEQVSGLRISESKTADPYVKLERITFNNLQNILTIFF
jgi:hypothetical protein